MKKYRIPDNVKEIMFDDEQLVYLEKKLVKKNKKWKIITYLKPLEKIERSF